MAEQLLKAESVSANHEIWKPVVGWEGFYEVSNHGQARSLDRILPCPNNQGRMSTRFFEGRTLRPKLTMFGYHTVALCRGGKMSHKFVHRLVVEAFIGPKPSEVHEVAHGNAIRTDNHISNLRWATKRENGQDKVMHGNSMTGHKHGFSKLTEQAAFEIIATKGLRRSGQRTRDLAKKHGVSVANIHRVRADKNCWKHLKGDRQ